MVSARSLARVMWGSLISACTANPPAPAAERPEVEPVVVVPEPTQLDRRRDAPASVSGTVRDHTGEPFAGAQVCAWNLDPNGDEGIPRCVISDAAGVYALTGLVPTHQAVFASAEGRQPVGEARLPLQPGEQQTGVDLRLVAGGARIDGVVRDVHGQAIAGASVSNFDVDVAAVWRGGSAATRSDAEGRFTLWVLPGPQSLVARKDGFTRARVVDVVAPGRYTLEIERGATLVGQVLDTRGAPVAGARVSAIPGGGKWRDGIAYTDAEGRYAIGGLRPGLYKAKAEAPGLRGEAARSTFVGPAATSSPQVVSLLPAASVSGRMIVDGSSQTCSRGQVWLGYDVDSTYIALAGPAGEVYFPAVQPGSYYFDADCPGAVAATERPTLDVAEAPLRGLVWRFAPGRSIRGVIVDATGQPQAGAGASAWSTATACSEHCLQPPVRGGWPCVADEECDADEACVAGGCSFGGMPGRGDQTWVISEAGGRFVFEGLPPGRYRISGASARRDLSAQEVEARDADVDEARLVEPPRGRVEGVVVDEGGAPRSGAVVDLLAERDGQLERSDSARTDDDGRFTLFAVEPGEYRVRARPPAAHDVEVQRRRPVRGELAARVDAKARVELRLQLVSGRGEIRGRVRGPDGAPVAEAFVRALREATPDELAMQGLQLEFAGARVAKDDRSRLRRGALDAAARTDEAGEFRLAGLGEGSYTLWVHRGGGFGEVFEEHVRSGSEVKLALPATFELAGRLADPSSGRFTLTLRRGDGEVVREERFVDTGGRWAFEGVPAGTYELQVEDGGRRGSKVVSLADRSLAELVLALAPAGP